MRLSHWICMLFVLITVFLVNQEADAFFTARAEARHDARHVSRAVFHANIAAHHATRAGGCSGASVQVTAGGCSGASIQVIRSATIVRGNGCSGGAGCAGGVPMAPKAVPGK